ncbi:MAG: hypothetical protein NTZ19_04350 [Bacteroidetes bacterium]|nr:hypothetical protein [Bacteroidota bacterium]
MNKPSFIAIQISATALVALFIGAILIWEKFHGGVVTHHLLQRSDLPGISNWWGIVLLPFLSWVSFYRIQKRFIQIDNGRNTQQIFIRNSVLGFLGALLFGIVLAVAFSNGYANFIDYQVDFLLLLLLFVPIYRSEYILGFVMGMSFALGAILPTAFALIIALLSSIIYLYLRPLILRIFKRKEKK